jgi:hypothetical protein
MSSRGVSFSNEHLPTSSLAQQKNLHFGLLVVVVGVGLHSLVANSARIKVVTTPLFSCQLSPSDRAPFLPNSSWWTEDCDP